MGARCTDPERSGKTPNARSIARWGPPAWCPLVLEHVRLIEEVDLSYPIILGPHGRVMDGMHRVARAILEARQTITAVRLTEVPDPDFRNCSPDELPY